MPYLMTTDQHGNEHEQWFDISYIYDQLNDEEKHFIFTARAFEVIEEMYPQIEEEVNE